ncbi:MAG: Fe3+/spermidine/putrescine ABC transporter ATP-binding protein [Oscillospiraceae bacterium]|nr:MAG: Fe3+/spermidine/putrescine ABC transporter ATP-binding protein [Oscillospiraceae bacterium]
MDVQLERVTKRYEGKTVVDRLDLSVARGTFLSILGPSGCGKTTTLRMIGGFITPDEGTVRIAGEDVTALPPAARSTSMVFQDYALFPHMTVADNIGFGLRMQRVPRDEAQKRVAQALEMVGLPGYGQRKPSQLSGGQRQRIALARSLVLKPTILLLDEPLGALDAQIRKQMQFELKQLQTSLGQTFLYVTHDQEEAMTMSDQVAIMRGGVIEQLGAPDEVYDNPRTLFVAQFLGECSSLHGRCEQDGTFVSQALGPIRGRFTGTPFAGPAVLCIRPEHVVFAPRGQQTPENRISFPAVVQQRMFKGLNTWLCADCGAERIICEVTGKSPLHAGEEITLSFDPANALILPDSGEQAPAPAEEVAL